MKESDGEVETTRTEDSMKLPGRKIAFKPVVLSINSFEFIFKDKLFELKKSTPKIGFVLVKIKFILKLLLKDFTPNSATQCPKVGIHISLRPVSLISLGMINERGANSRGKIERSAPLSKMNSMG